MDSGGTLMGKKKPTCLAKQWPTQVAQQSGEFIFAFRHTAWFVSREMIVPLLQGLDGTCPLHQPCAALADPRWRYDLLWLGSHLHVSGLLRIKACNNLLSTFQPSQSQETNGLEHPSSETGTRENYWTWMGMSFLALSGLSRIPVFFLCPTRDERSF